jgi:hypothetical protein
MMPLLLEQITMLHTAWAKQPFNDIISLFTQGIDPNRGGGGLDIAPVATNSQMASAGATAGGSAYRNGPFILVANREHTGRITDVNQIGGILVNEGIATPEVLASLRELMPNLAIEPYSNTKGLIEQLNQKGSNLTQSPANETNTGLELYHGSPHAFENFDISQLGSGEGAQAFGHGLYFTNSKDIANIYANALSSKKHFWEFLKNGNELSLTKKDFDFVKKELDALGSDGYVTEQHGLNDILVDRKPRSAPEVIEALSYLFGKGAKNALSNNTRGELGKFDLTEDQIDRLLEIKKKISNPQLYQVAVHEGKKPSEFDYIEWRDKLSKSQTAKIGLDLPDNLTGEQAYKFLSKKLGSDKAASDYLLSKSIDGITYKSYEGTGGKDGKGRNYVVFNDKAVSVKSINGQNLKSTLPVANPTQDLQPEVASPRAAINGGKEYGTREYRNGESQVQGKADIEYLPDGSKIDGQWKVVDAATLTPSHDPNTFKPNPLSPTDNKGNSLRFTVRQ